MKNIKNLLALLLALTMLLGLCACGEAEAETTTTAETTTEAPTTETTTEAATEASGTTYTVTVQSDNGEPIANAMVQICLDACIPAVTDNNGVAVWTVEEADYKVSFLALPTGYTYADDVQEFYFDGETELTITLKAEA